jgi:hypothetical protein
MNPVIVAVGALVSIGCMAREPSAEDRFRSSRRYGAPATSSPDFACTAAKSALIAPGSIDLPGGVRSMVKNTQPELSGSVRASTTWGRLLRTVRSLRLSRCQGWPT